MSPPKTNFILIKILTFLATFPTLLAYSIYRGDWWTGYFQDGDYCKPWDTSWKDCSNADSCDTWEEYMFLNTTTALWESWPDGEYWDDTGRTWRSCSGGCNLLWGYQEMWFDWPTDEVFNINTFECQPDWDSNMIRIESPILKISKIWRDNEYYLDPFSTKPIELGTLEYPYRSMNLINLEIMNFFSHSNQSITIYTKNAYIEDTRSKFINMSSVTITSHPDVLNLKKVSMIIPTSLSQPAIWK